MSDRMKDAETGQISPEAAQLYERFFVPALFDQWPGQLLELAGVRAGDRVLDVACGTGVLARTAQALVGPTGSLTGLDLNAGMLTVAAQAEPGVTWVSGPAEALSMADESFDRVLCQFGLMFFADREAAVREMARVTRPGGQVCVATWAGLAESPGYAALTDLLEELFGREPAEALGAPFSLGTEAELRGAMAAAFDQVAVQRLEGRARFPSIDDWVATDVRAWTLRDMLDDRQFEDLRAAAQVRLREFCDADGRVAFDAPALVALASP
jgi:SAM-dependent methyltransferase